jgi:hypothetical protein
MPLGTSMLRGSHCGSNHTGDDCGVGGHGGDRHQRSWMTQQLLSAPLHTSPPLISKQSHHRSHHRNWRKMGFASQYGTLQVKLNTIACTKCSFVQTVSTCLFSIYK